MYKCKYLQHVYSVYSLTLRCVVCKSYRDNRNDSFMSYRNSISLESNVIFYFQYLLYFINEFNCIYNWFYRYYFHVMIKYSLFYSPSQPYPTLSPLADHSFTSSLLHFTPTTPHLRTTTLPYLNLASLPYKS